MKSNCLTEIGTAQCWRWR